MKSGSVKILIVLIIIIAGAFNRLVAQEAIFLSKITEPIEFDGRPFEDSWRTANEFKTTMWRPQFGTEPSESSDIRIGYDDQYLWIGASLYMKDVSKIFVATKRRDELMWDYDAFGLILDSYNDNENGLGFFTNPVGVRTDFAISNDGSFSGGTASPTNYSWDTFWDVKTTRDNKGWYLEMKIPFSSLKFKTEDGVATMGLILNRSISSNNETDLYPAIDIKYGYSAFMKPSQAAKIKIRGALPAKPIYLAPYILGGFSRDQVLNHSATAFENKDKPQMNIGLDVKYNINSNLTLDLTANTDFAQVEADDQQVNLTQYALFYPEKRKFFQERSSLFDFRLGGVYDNLFYSRNIGLANGNQVHIYGGARLTGRIGKWDLGLLDMQTANYDTLPGENFGVLRMRRQIFNKNTYVGGIYTSRIDINGKMNIAYGLDGIFRLFKDDYLGVKWSQAYDSEVDNKLTSMKPTFFLINLERRSIRGIGYNVNYIYSGRDFNPGIGFVMRHGVQGLNASVLYGFIPKDDSRWLNLSVNLSGNILKRIDNGSFESLLVNPFVSITTKKGYFETAGIQYQKAGVAFDFYLSRKIKIPAGDYTFTQAVVSVFKTSAGKFSFTSSGNIGQFYDGQRVGFIFGPIVNLSSSINLTATYGYNAIRFPHRETNKSLDIHSINTRISYMLSTKFSVSLMFQYMNTQDDLITNFRIRYNPREGNDFYLVYNDSRALAGDITIPDTPVFFNKTIMVKYIYTFKL